MTVKKRKKVVRYRGSKTHGCGSMKKRRGAGNRGGRGMAGTGKRAHTKKPSILQDFGSSYLGKHGFKRPKKTVTLIKAVNIGFLEEKFDKLLSKGVVKEEKGSYSIDLKSLKANKLLGSGKVNHKWNITCEFASGSAVEKVKKAGGSVNCGVKEEKVEKEKAEKPKEKAE